MHYMSPMDPLNIVTNICNHLETKISLAIDVFMQTCLQSLPEVTTTSLRKTEIPASLKLNAFPQTRIPSNLREIL